MASGKRAGVSGGVVVTPFAVAVKRFPALS